MSLFALILYIAAWVVLVLAIFPIPSRINLVALGLALWLSAYLADGHLHVS